MTLLERDELLALLTRQQADAAAGAGRLVLVEGEAGIGKTTLLRAFAQSVQEEAPVYWGACDAMHTPRPLAALEDIAAGASAAMRALLAGSQDRHRLFVAFVDLLAERPAVAVLDDVHWADDATLDLLRYAGRRIARTRSLLVASYRSDEVVPTHPLRGVLGDLATTGALRMALQPLSLQAVRLLAEGRNVDVVDLHGKTTGNPFFVTEVLAAGGSGVPATVQDAVLARAARLSRSARAVLDAAAVAGPRIEPWLLQELTAAEAESIDECLATGVLRADGGSFAFRHELARQAVLQAMTPTRSTSLHRLALQALNAVGGPRPDPARLALHAGGAGDRAGVLRWAPEAARAAAARGAHRQAARQWGHALEHAAGGAERAALLDAYAVEVHMSVGVDEAIASRREAARLWCEEGRPGNAAISLARQSVLFMYSSRIAEGERAVRQASALVAGDNGSPADFIVQSCAAWLSMLKRDCEEAIALAQPVLAEAERTSDAAETAASLKTIGGSLLYSGRVDEGIAHLERGLAVAMAANEDRLAGQVLANLGSGCIGALRLDQAETFLRQGIEYCSERDLDAPRLFQTGWLAILELMRGRWDAAARAANEVIQDGRATVIGRIAALIALARLRARRGDPGVEALLDEADRLASDTDVYCRIARAEAAWLEGRPEDAASEAAALLPLGIAKHRSGAAAELLLWSGPDNAGTEMPPLWAASPFALEVAGRWQDAAAAWRALRCPYETARALTAGNEAAQREALAVFESLGARPMVERVRRGLRAAGIRSLPRGPLASTRAHAAGLTSKEVAVLALLATGLRNKEIALRLSRSVRTIDHHLQTIFAKLAVSTRAEAVSAAYRLGIVKSEASALRQLPVRSSVD